MNVKELVIAVSPDLRGTQSYSDRWLAKLHELGVNTKVVDILSPDIFNQLDGCNGLMWRFNDLAYQKRLARSALITIEKYLNLKVFPDWNTAWHYDEKIYQHYLFRVLNIPTPRTFLFWRREDALDWLEKTQEIPLVLKLSSGAGSKGVIKINSYREAKRWIDKMFFWGVKPYLINETFKGKVLKYGSWSKNIVNELLGLDNMLPGLSQVHDKDFGYIYFQEFVQDNSYDTRITIIGNRAFGFRRFNRDGDFRASGSGKIDWDIKKIDPKCVQLAFDISNRLNLQSMSYDFLFKRGLPVINEMSYTFADWAVQKCPGFWDKELNWHGGNIWPEETQVIDFINQFIVQ